MEIKRFLLKLYPQHKFCNIIKCKWLIIDNDHCQLNSELWMHWCLHVLCIMFHCIVRKRGKHVIGTLEVSPRLEFQQGSRAASTPAVKLSGSFYGTARRGRGGGGGETAADRHAGPYWPATTREP